MFPAVPTITVEDLPAGSLLLDVREDDEWRAGHRNFWARSDGLDITDDTRVVCVAFDLVERFDV